MGPSLLRVEGLSAGYGELQVLREVSLTVRQGSVTALVGNNAAGKTTLMKAVAGFVACTSGATEFQGREIGQDPIYQRVRNGLILVPEERWIFPGLTVHDNLELGGASLSSRGAIRCNLDYVYELFPRLRERKRQLGGLLSGGEQQMLALGRGLMGNPKLLLLDEPTLGLAPMMARSLFTVVELIREAGITVLMAEQDIENTLRVSDYAYVVENGQNVQEGKASDLLSDEGIREAYFGLGGGDS